jgi:hypothetical protein
LNFTIGYISHDQSVHARFLGPSLTALRGNFEVISVSDELFPAVNYNKLKAQAHAPYLILTHQDVSFSPDLLERIESTIYAVGDFGALGMVGVDQSRLFNKWSTPHQVHELDTADCCFIVIKTNNQMQFDGLNFDEYHLYVEDYCAQLKRIYGQKIFTILTSSSEASPYTPIIWSRPTFLDHHSVTLNECGFCWGRYWEFRGRLESKWPGIKTT